MKRKEVFGFLNIPLLRHDIVLCCLDDFNNIVIHLNKKKNKEISDFLRKHLGNNFETNELNHLDGVVFYQKKNNYPVMLCIKNIKRGWDFYETLIHETHHLVEKFANYCKFQNETEFKARLQEYLFRTIRKIIK